MNNAGQYTCRLDFIQKQYYIVAAVLLYIAMHSVHEDSVCITRNFNLSFLEHMHRVHVRSYTAYYNFNAGTVFWY